MIVDACRHCTGGGWSQRVLVLWLCSGILGVLYVDSGDKCGILCTVLVFVWDDQHLTIQWYVRWLSVWSPISDSSCCVGGSYGFARVTTGPYLGFIVGFFDSVSNIIYVSLYVRTFVDVVHLCFDEGKANTDWDPLWWAVMYVGCSALQILLQQHNFKVISLFGFICLCIPIVFIFGTAHLQNFKVNVIDLEKVMHHVSFALGTPGFVSMLPYSAMMYFGVDMVCLVCEDTHDVSSWCCMA